MSLDKIRHWIATQGRVDFTKDRSERELEVLRRIFRIVMDLDGVSPHQGAKAGKGAEQHDLDFGRRMETRKTPLLFCGVLLSQREGGWMRRSDLGGPEHVRIYVRLTPEGVRRSAWSDRIKDDDSLKSDPDWRYIEIPPVLPIAGDEILDLIEDAHLEASGL